MGRPSLHRESMSLPSVVQTPTDARDCAELIPDPRRLPNSPPMSGGRGTGVTKRTGKWPHRVRRERLLPTPPGGSGRTETDGAAGA